MARRVASRLCTNQRRTVFGKSEVFSTERLCMLRRNARACACEKDGQPQMMATSPLISTASYFEVKEKTASLLKLDEL